MTRMGAVLVVTVLPALTLLASPAQAERKRRPVPAATSATPAATPEEPPPAAAAPTKPKLPGAPSATVFVFEDLGVPLAAQSLSGFAGALAADPRVRYGDVVEYLDPLEEATARLSSADEDLAASLRAFDQMDLDAARAKAETALKGYERYLPRLASQETGLQRLRDVWARLAAIRFFDANNDGAKEALRHVLVLVTKNDFSPKIFPPQMKKLVVESRLLFETLGSGKLTVTSEPPGATLYVNGAAQGVTPMTVEDVPAGPVYVTLEARGYQPLLAVVEINGGGEESRSEHKLERWEGDPPAQLASARASFVPPVDGKRKGPPDEALPAPVKAAMERLKVDLLVLVTLEKQPRGGTLQTTARLYDRRAGRLLKQLEDVTPESQLPHVGRRLATALLDGARLDGARQDPTKKKRPSGPSIFAGLGEKLATFRRSNAFWPTIGGVVGGVVVGGAVGLGAGLGGARHGLTPSEQVILLGAGN